MIESFAHRHGAHRHTDADAHIVHGRATNNNCGFLFHTHTHKMWNDIIISKH